MISRPELRWSLFPNKTIHSCSCVDIWWNDGLSHVFGHVSCGRLQDWMVSSHVSVSLPSVGETYIRRSKRKTMLTIFNMIDVTCFYCFVVVDFIVFSALTLLVGQQEGIQPVKNEWCGAGVVICLGRGTDLHMAQLIPLPLTVSCSRKSRFVLVLPFWYWLTRVVPV